MSDASRETPRADHHRVEFKRRKEWSELVEWVVDELGGAERALAAAKAEVGRLGKERDDYRAAATLHGDACVRLTAQYAAAESALREERDRVMEKLGAVLRGVGLSDHDVAIVRADLTAALKVKP